MTEMLRPRAASAFALIVSLAATSEIYQIWTTEIRWSRLSVIQVPILRIGIKIITHE